MGDKGVHYIINACGCERNLADTEAVRKMLLDLVRMAGMNKLSEPTVVFHNAKNKLNSGVTGIILLSESHISIHTYSERGDIYMDMFSCRPFDVDIVKAYVTELFGMAEIDEQVIRRGLIL